MKRFFAFLLALLLLSSMLFSCNHGEEKGIVGVWRSQNLSSEAPEQNLVYAFASNGHMLSINLYDGEIASVLGACYEYDEAKGVLRIVEYGKDDGEMNAVLSGDSLTLSLVSDEGGVDLSDKSISFTREAKPKESAFVGNWLYAYIDENGKTVQVQYAFTEDGKSARALYEGSDLSDGILTDYVAQTYTVQTVNGEELLYIFTENANGTQAALEVYRIAFPYDGYMTMEPITENEGVNEVMPFCAISEAEK